MSATPRTATMLEANGLHCACAEKPIDLCVQLERELADVTAERDAEREARKALVNVISRTPHIAPGYVTYHIIKLAALALVAKLP